MKRYLQLCLFGLILASVNFSCKKEDLNKIPSDKVPEVETVAAVLLDKYNVFCSGIIGKDNGYTVTARGFCWSSTNISPTIEDEKYLMGAGAGAFTDTLFAFTPGTIFFIRAFATNAAGTAYGSTMSFETAAGELPSISTQYIYEITTSSATCCGSISFSGGSSITARGVVWGSNATVSIDDCAGKTIDGTGTGLFTSQITGLAQRTTYYVRAYATNELKEIAKNLHSNHLGNFPLGQYWCSTESDKYDANYISFKTNGEYSNWYGYKGASLHVLAARHF